MNTDIDTDIKLDTCEYAFYSEKQAHASGHTLLYKDENGKEFEVTEVGHSPITTSKWDDIIRLPTTGVLTYVGEFRKNVMDSKSTEDLILLYGSLGKPLPKYFS